MEAGIFHHFHHGWIEEIARALNRGVLPDDSYAMAERYAAHLGPDVLTLQELGNGEASDGGPTTSARSPGGAVTMTSPAPRTAQTDMAHYRRKQNTVTVRHVSGDRIVAMVEVVSPGNKAGRNPFRSFVEKAAELLDKRIHLLILDLHPPGRRAPNGAHAAIWEEITGEDCDTPPAKPLTLASYESGLIINAYVVPVAVGEALPDMPLYLEPEACVLVPLEATYQAAFDAVPRRWRQVLEAI